MAAADLAAQLSVASRLRVDETFAALEELSVKWSTHIRILEMLTDFHFNLSEPPRMKIEKSFNSLDRTASTVFLTQLAT